MSHRKNISLKNLNAFLRKNKSVDCRTADFQHASSLEDYKWSGLEDQQEAVVEQLKAYQRLLRIVPAEREDLAKDLLKKGIGSSLQIVSMPKRTFIQNNLKVFDGDRHLATHVYKRALAVRKAVALQYISQKQRTEPYAHAGGLAS